MKAHPVKSNEINTATLSNDTKNTDIAAEIASQDDKAVYNASPQTVAGRQELIPNEECALLAKRDG